MNKRKKFKGLIRNQTCDNCNLYRNTEGVECCTFSMLGRDLPDERTCSRWTKLIELQFTSTTIKGRPRKLKVKWTKETELDIQDISVSTEEKLIEQAVKEIQDEQSSNEKLTT